ncbi:efflux RND transporter periplasmic adaptor subunit [Amycolatopsis thermophila]|uniref:Multidrug efflux pump subunit AcrA (Membrane-fusion protein) n=1 Tax=Amycolatopsis thermophila TaxID=206084 RepID=A0ABU0F5X8_9PSEU|nr:HlyD family efflux transporter periplasmic adaptor subunit [Amycolatopsis thermophila]MDQ0382932.1 multidrug efflux pump subunit AcrA (membrane-fusion protein) [Amycolatopsis thermophila]
MLGRLRKRRRWAIGGVAVVVVAAAVTLWLVTRPADAPSYRLVAASTTTLKQTVSSSGTIEPAQQSNLDFGVSGQVTAVDVAVGQQVTAGQTLATLQSASLAAGVAQAQSSLASDQAKLSSDESSNASPAQLSADRAAITAAQNQVDNAQAALNEATMTSPIAGTVAAVNLTVGQQVSAGSTSSASSPAQGGGANTNGSGGTNGGSGNNGSGGTNGGSSSSASSSAAQIVVISTGSYIVNASVDDTEVGQIKTGDQAVITPNGSNAPVYGTVASVAVMAAGSSSVPSYPVTISVTGSPPGLFAGAGATVSIVVKQLSDVLAVPSQAVHYNGSQATVNEMVGGKQVSKPITVGTSVGGMTQVLSGLSEGDQVMMPGPAGATGGTTRGGSGPNGRTGGAGGFPGGGRGGFGGLGG